MLHIDTELLLLKIIFTYLGYTKQQDDDDLCPSQGDDDNNVSLRCALCGDKERKKSRYATWGESERTYLVKHLGKPLSDNALVCRRPSDMVKDVNTSHHGRQG